MAKRKKSKARRIGAVRRRSSSKLDLTKIAGLIAGGVGGSAIANFVESKVSNEHAPKIAAAAVLAAGVFLPKFAKGNLASAVADGMVVSGGIRLLQEFNALSGVPFISGWSGNSLISGVVPGPKVSGFNPSTAHVTQTLYARRRD